VRKFKITSVKIIFSIPLL